MADTKHGLLKSDIKRDWCKVHACHSKFCYHGFMMIFDNRPSINPKDEAS